VEDCCVAVLIECRASAPSSRQNSGGLKAATKELGFGGSIRWVQDSLGISEGRY